MIKLEHVVLASPEQMEFIIEGMRNPMNSHDKSDSYMNYSVDFENKEDEIIEVRYPYYKVGAADVALMQRLANAGTDHRKFMRMMSVYVRITAPLYWWKEFDTYRTGVTPNPMDIEINSCSTMHKIQEKGFTLEDFSCEHLNRIGTSTLWDIIDILNVARKLYLEGGEYKGEYYEAKDKRVWWQMIQLLPSSYNQTRNVMMNYEVLANIYKSRKNHKLDEWCVHETPEEYKFINKDFSSGMWGFCDWIETLPYSELICNKKED